MKNMKKIISALLMLCMMAALLCVPAFADDNTVSGMTITPASYNIPYGSTDNVSLQVQLQPLDATNIGAGHDIVWSLNGKTFTNKANAAGVTPQQFVDNIVEGERGRVKEEIARLKALNEGIGNSVGVILFEEKAFLEAAHDFFARLRDLDNEGVDMIIAGAMSDSDGVGFAVMNRMLKSAGYNIVKV